MKDSNAFGKLATELVPTTIEQEAQPMPDVPCAVTVMSSRSADYGRLVEEVAQKLHAQVYLDNGFIQERDVDENGIYLDKYSHRSTYLLAENEHRRSACRYIRADKKDGLLSLPTAEHFSLNPDIIKQTANVHRLSDLKPREVIEVSGLASMQLLDSHTNKNVRRDELDATRLLYASIIRHSLDEGHKLWLLNIDEKLLRSLEILIGREQVNRLGEAQEYMGPATVPIAINPQEVVRAAFADDTAFGDMKRQYLLESLPGVSGKYLPSDIKAMLTEYNIPYNEDSRLKRLLANRKTMAYAAILGYSSARALPVGAVEEFEGSVAALWAIDVGTAVPYTWGVIETATAKTHVRRAVGATVASGSFVAPYAYFWAEGQDYPPHVNAVVGGLIGAATLLEVTKVRKDRTIASRLLKQTNDIRESS